MPSATDALAPAPWPQLEPSRTLATFSRDAAGNSRESAAACAHSQKTKHRGGGRRVPRGYTSGTSGTVEITKRKGLVVLWGGVGRCSISATTPTLTHNARAQAPSHPPLSLRRVPRCVLDLIPCDASAWLADGSRWDMLAHPRTVASYVRGGGGHAVIPPP